MVTDTEALIAIDVIASYCNEHHSCSTCILQKDCEKMADKEAPIPWLIDEMLEGEN